MGLRILIINPNTMKSPPLIPIGLEYLAAALEKNYYIVEGQVVIYGMIGSIS